MTELVTFSHNSRNEVLEILKKGYSGRDLPMAYYNMYDRCYLMNSKVKGKKLGKGVSGTVYSYTITNGKKKNVYAMKVVSSEIDIIEQECPNDVCSVRAMYDNFIDNYGYKVPPYEFVKMINGGSESVRRGQMVYMPDSSKETFECRLRENVRSPLFYFIYFKSAEQQDIFDGLVPLIEENHLDLEEYRRNFLEVNRGIISWNMKGSVTKEYVMIPYFRGERYFTYPKGSYLCGPESYSENLIAVLCSQFVESGECINFIHTFDISMCPTLPPADEALEIKQYIFMEKITGTLNKVIDKYATKVDKKTMTKEAFDDFMRSIFVQVLFGLCTMQQTHSIQHNDLHTGNVMYQTITNQIKYDGKKVSECSDMEYHIVDTRGRVSSIYLPITKDSVIAKIGDFGYSVKFSEPIVGGRDVTTGHIDAFTGCFAQWEARCADIITFTFFLFANAFVHSPFIRRVMSWMIDPDSIESGSEGIFRSMKPKDIQSLLHSDKPNMLNEVVITKHYKGGMRGRMNLKAYYDGRLSHILPLEMITNESLLGVSPKGEKKQCLFGTLRMSDTTLPPPTPMRNEKLNCIKEVSKNLSIKKEVVKRIIEEKYGLL